MIQGLFYGKNITVASVPAEMSALGGLDRGVCKTVVIELYIVEILFVYIITYLANI